MFDLFVSPNHVRLNDPQVVPSTLMATARAIGLTDSERPTAHKIGLAARGLFAACIDIRANAIARAINGGPSRSGFTVKRLTAQAEYEDVELTHPWVRLLLRPNTNRPALEVWRWASEARDYAGSADFVVEDNARGTPIALHEIFPEFGHISPVPNAGGGDQGYVFFRADGRRVELEARDVVRLRHTDPRSPYRSMSLLQKAAYQLDKGLYADIYERDTLREGRFPPVVLTSDQEVSKAQAGRYGKQFKDAYMRTGTHTVKGIPVLGKGLKAQPTLINPNDLALIESGRLNDKRLFWTTGVPQGMVDHEANRANTDGQRRTFAEYTVQPSVDLIAAQMSYGFSRSFGEPVGLPASSGASGASGASGLVIHAPNVVPVDPMQQARIDEIQIRSGTLKPNEVRRREGRDDVEGGDQAFVSAALRPLAAGDAGGSISQGGGDERSFT